MTGTASGIGDKADLNPGKADNSISMSGIGW
jgi:hypothetical protein